MAEGQGLARGETVEWALSEGDREAEGERLEEWEALTLLQAEAAAVLQAASAAEASREAAVLQAVMEASGPSHSLTESTTSS